MSENKNVETVETLPTAATTTPAPAPAEAAAVAKADSELSLVERIERTMKAYMDVQIKNMEEKISATIKAAQTKVEADAEHALRKGLGVEVDPVLHMSDLVPAMRKAMLEVNGENKKSPVAAVKADGPDGNAGANDPLNIYDVEVKQ